MDGWMVQWMYGQYLGCAVPSGTMVPLTIQKHTAGALMSLNPSQRLTGCAYLVND